MPKNVLSTFVLLIVCCIAFYAQGCKKDGQPAAESMPQTESTVDAHAALHNTKYNQTLVEFPGHKYSMEITHDETAGLVTAYLTDAHFNPVDIDAKEVQLNFLVDGTPKAFTLVRSEPESGKPASFTLIDKELATLNCDGWQGEATASVEISGTPYNAPLKKLGGHNHEEHDHTH